MPWQQQQQQQPVQQQQQQQVQLQPLCTQGLNAAATGMHSPLGTSCDSSDSMDPAVIELEQFMLQELAAADVLATDSSSAARLSQPPAAAVAAPALTHAQMNWHAAEMPQQQQQQQQQAPVVMSALQHQCSGVYTHAQQQQQWCRPAAVPVAACQLTSASMSTAAPTVVRAAMPAGVAGMLHPLQHSQAVPASCAAPAPAAVPAGSNAAGPRGRNAHVMAQLQDRLYALQSEMEDMQLMLGLLQNC
jgi:hypothetical protein